MEVLGKVDDLLDVIEVLAVDGDENLAGLVFEDILDLVGDLVVRRSDAGLVGSLAFGHEEEGLFAFGKTCHLRKVELETFQGGVIGDEIRGIDDVSESCLQGKAEGFADGMCGLEKLEGVAGNGDRVTRIDDSEIIGVDLPETFLVLAFDDIDGRLRRIDRSLADIQKVGKSSVLVIMAMRQDDTFDTMADGTDIFEVRNDDVDSGDGIVWILEAGFDDEGIVVDFDDIAVLAHLVETAQGNDLDRVVSNLPAEGHSFVVVCLHNQISLTNKIKIGVILFNTYMLLLISYIICARNANERRYKSISSMTGQ